MQISKKYVMYANEIILNELMKSNENENIKNNVHVVGNTIVEVCKPFIPKETKLIGTGLFFEIPNGLEVQIRPRSGLAVKNLITVLNSPGTIDADYRGEVKVILINHGLEMFEIEDKMRIAQMVVSKYEEVNFELVSDLSESERGSGGFGSTGTK